MLTSAAISTLGRIPTTTTAIVATVSVVIATMPLSGRVNLGGQLATNEDRKVRDGPVGGGALRISSVINRWGAEGK